MSTVGRPAFSNLLPTLTLTLFYLYPIADGPLPILSTLSSLQASHSRGRGSGRQSDARTSRRMEKEAEMGEKAAAYRAKEQDTMAMFKALAAQRFGGGGGAGAGAAQ